MHAGVCQRVHLVHHQRRYANPFVPSWVGERWHYADFLSRRKSFRKVSTREAQDSQRRGHSLCHDFFGVRELCRSPEDLSLQISRSEFCLATPPPISFV